MGERGEAREEGLMAWPGLVFMWCWIKAVGPGYALHSTLRLHPPHLPHASHSPFPFFPPSNYVQMARPGLVFMWCWIAAVGPGYVRREAILLGARRLRASQDADYELGVFDQQLDDPSKVRASAAAVPVEARAEVALGAILHCCEDSAGGSSSGAGGGQGRGGSRRHARLLRGAALLSLYSNALSFPLPNPPNPRVKTAPVAAAAVAVEARAEVALDAILDCCVGPPSQRQMDGDDWQLLLTILGGVFPSADPTALENAVNARREASLPGEGAVDESSA
ncbi:unnamed protein product [Closterium sp. NIES-65]|nr:unnamed protein product [Closterium sp. NIES-65]